MSTGTAVAEQSSPQQISPAAQQRARVQAFMQQIEKRLPEIEALLAESNTDPKRFVECCRRALMRDPELVNCNPGSFIHAALNCASDGLEPDGRKAAFVRFKREVQYVPMYQGLLDIAYRSGNFQSIEAHPVYEGDEFDFALGDKPFIHHKPTLERDTSKIRGAYSVARTVNGGVFREVMGARELAKVKAVSRAKTGPNVDWPGEMARKAPLRRLWKFLPHTPAMERVIEHDDATYDQSMLPAANDGPKLAPGFAAPQALAAPDGEPDQDAGGHSGDHEADFGIEDDSVPDFPPTDDDDFPGDRQSAPQSAPEAPAPKSLSQRVDDFKARCLDAKTSIKLKNLKAAHQQLFADLDLADPEEKAGLDAWWQDWFDTTEATEKGQV